MKLLLALISIEEVHTLQHFQYYSRYSCEVFVSFEIGILRLYFLKKMFYYYLNIHLCIKKTFLYF